MSSSTLTSSECCLHMVEYLAQDSERLKHVDGLRAVAVLSVVLYHFDILGLSGGFVGVDVFFVISGFLVSKYVLKDLEKGTFEFKHFYIRRCYRLLPAHLTLLLGTSLCSFLMASADIALENARSTLYSLSASSNFYFWSSSDYFAMSSVNRPLLHTWSLSLEEQFYVVWPAVLAVMFQMRKFSLGVSSQLMAFLAATCAASFTVLPSAHMARFFFMPFRAYEFTVGALCMYLDGWINRPHVADCASLLGAGLLAWSFIYIRPANFPSISVFSCLAGSTLMLCSPRSVLNRTIMSSRVMVYVSDISYSLYLVHWPIRVFAGLAFLSGGQMRHVPASLKIFMLITSFALAHALHALVEDPMRSRRAEVANNTRSGMEESAKKMHSFGRFRLRYMAFCVIATFGAALSALWTSGWEFRPSIGNDVTNIESSSAIYKKVMKTCVPIRRGQPICGIEYGTCSIGPRNCSRDMTYLLGDSHARHLAPAFDTIARSREIAVLCSEVLACPPLNYDESFDLPPVKNEKCEQMRTHVKDLMRVPPGLVVISAHWEMHIGSIRRSDVNWTDASKNSTASLSSKFATALLSFIRSLAAVGHRVVIIGATPWLRNSPYTCLQRRGWIGVRCSLVFEQSEVLVSVNEVLQSVVGQCAGCRYIDPVPEFCETLSVENVTGTVAAPNAAYIPRCYFALNKSLLFRDRDHLTYEGALALVKRIDKIYQ